jgi:hypothetical protein
MRLGPCYLEAQVGIDTQEDIFLDFSVAAFQALLDALTVSQVDIGEALLQIARERAQIKDLKALLCFIGLEWVLGKALPLPPQPQSDMPRADGWATIRQNIAFDLAISYHRQAGVFHHLMKSEVARANKSKTLWNVALPLPCRYASYEVNDVPLTLGEVHVEPTDLAADFCIPISLETDVYSMGGDVDCEFCDWADDGFSRVSSIYMLGGLAASCGEKLELHAGSAAVIDLGARRALRCEGLVVGVARTEQSTGLEDCHDILTVETLCDFDDESADPEMILCQKLLLDSSKKITYFHLPVPAAQQRLGRMFRMTFHPFQPHVMDYSDFRAPLYELHVAELFGDLLELPAALVGAEDQLRDSFAMDSNTRRTRRRQMVNKKRV